MMSRQTYNFVAKRIREDFPTSQDNDITELVKRGTLVDLALRCAYGFKKDNERFEALDFLEKCSPNNDLFPITELWPAFFLEQSEAECVS